MRFTREKVHSRSNETKTITPGKKESPDFPATTSRGDSHQPNPYHKDLIRSTIIVPRELRRSITPKGLFMITESCKNIPVRNRNRGNRKSSRAGDVVLSGSIESKNCPPVKTTVKIDKSISRFPKKIPKTRPAKAISLLIKFAMRASLIIITLRERALKE